MKIKARKKMGFDLALDIFKAASKHVPAYRDFLKVNSINPKSIKTVNDFSELPVINKKNYTSQYALPEMSWNGLLDNIINFPMSSGTSGEPYFWPSGSEQDRDSSKMFSELLSKILGVENSSLLFVSSFAMGTWKAGIEVYDAVKSIAEEDSRISIVTPSIDKYEALKQIQHLAKYFDKIILAGYPPFVKDIIQLALDAGMDLKSLDLYLITAGEAFSENWRDGLLALIGRAGETQRLLNFYGMAETGIIGFETTETIALRRRALNEPVVREFIGGTGATSLYSYDPALRYIEVVGGREIILTCNAGIPLIRYDTRDEGGLLESGALTPGLLKGNAYIFLFGRKDVSATLYGVNIYIENIKAALESKALSKKLSGLFVMETKNKKNLDQYIYLKVETSQKVQPTTAFQKQITDLLFNTLLSVNAEYKKLESSIGVKAKPRVKLVKYGDLQVAPGKKHRWVKKS